MEKGYVENAFIVDLGNTKKASEVIYELSKILEMPEAKGKALRLKLGAVNLTEQELVSIKALVDIMGAQIEFISSTSDITKTSAKEVGIEIDNVDATVIPALDITATEEKNESVNAELETALDKIFGEGDFEERYPEKDENNEKEEAKDTESTQTNAGAETDEPEKAVEGDVQVVEFDETEDWEELRKNDRETEKLPTLYIHRTLRSGQSISSEGNIVIIGDVNPGAEIIAKGDITVWGILGGIAHAGSDGNAYSKIRALKLNAIQIRIGNIFARRPDTVNTPYIHRTDSFVPEEARVKKNHIMIYKLHESK